MSSFEPRFPGTVAPDGLMLIQELINTRFIRGKGSDLFSAPRTANEWMARTLTEWSLRTGIPAALSSAAHPSVGEADLERLVALRADLERSLRDRATPVEAADASLRLETDGDGRLRLVPTGTGIDWFVGAVWGEMFAAQQADTLRRLKLCKNPGCSSAFYDRSKNNSGVWHDVHTCGNTANLKASRARKRAADSSPSAT